MFWATFSQTPPVTLRVSIIEWTCFSICYLSRREKQNCFTLHWQHPPPFKTFSTSVREKIQRNQANQRRHGDQMRL
jgi:hypothetical protein